LTLFRKDLTFLSFDPSVLVEEFGREPEQGEGNQVEGETVIGIR
jgi:hypothetical protein